MPSTGSSIKELRLSMGLSIRALARRADVSVAYLSKLERGESNPTIGLLRRIAEALNVPLETLVDSPQVPLFEEEMPASLRAFIDEYGAPGEKFETELSDPEYRRALLGVRLRGRYPDTSEEWLQIFLAIRQALSR